MVVLLILLKEKFNPFFEILHLVKEVCYNLRVGFSLILKLYFKKYSCYINIKSCYINIKRIHTKSLKLIIYPIFFSKHKSIGYILLLLVYK